jgi:hypothetical protein
MADFRHVMARLRVGVISWGLEKESMVQASFVCDGPEVPGE